MNGLLGTLRVRMTAETGEFAKGMKSAQRQLTTVRKDVQRFRNSTLANVASVGALTMALRSSLQVANEYDNAQRQLAATAKLTGVEFDYLQGVATKAGQQFKLSKVAANGFTIELTKLAGKAGDVGQASAGLEAFLDIGAARGLDAAQTLKAVQQSILGIDEGTDKLFSKNPSVLYKEYADSIGTTVGRLSDQQKAQAILTAALQDGSKVRGEYQKWLTSSQGQQYLLAQGIEETQAALGKALQPALVAVIPLMAEMAQYVQLSIKGWQMLGAKLATIPSLLQMIWHAATQNAKGFAAAALEYKQMAAAADEVIASLTKLDRITLPTLPTGTIAAGGTIGGTTSPTGAGPSLLDVKLALIRIQHSLERKVPDALAESITRSLPIIRDVKPMLGGSSVTGTAPNGWKDAAKELSGNIAASIMPRGSGLGGTIGQQAGSAVSKALKVGSGVLGSILLPGIGSLIGGAIGSLFGKDDKEQKKQTAALERIDQNTRQSATVLTNNRRAMDAARGAINVPARFALPTYTPKNVSVVVNQTNHITGGDPSKVVDAMRAELGTMLAGEFRRLGVA